MTAKPAMKQRLLDLIERFPDTPVAVIGDLIADQFLYGETARVSREAPVLVLKYQELVTVPGGAANAAHNLLDLGCRVVIAGQLGRDSAGDDLIRHLRKKKADVGNIDRSREITTPVKTRILAGAHHSAPQQIVRVDRENRAGRIFLPPLDALQKVLKGVRCVILSDYGYGVVESRLVRRLRSFCRQSSIPLLVDSRFRMADFHGVTAITPNITELEAAAGIQIGDDAALLHRIGRSVLRTQSLDLLLVTQGRFGMTLFRRRRSPLHIPVFGTDEVADVTGAGDTVIAVFALCLGLGADAQDAARLANYAGGIVVMKRGTATIAPDELRAAVREDLD